MWSLCDGCSHLVMNKLCWLSWESEGSHWFTRDVACKHQASSSRLLISCPSSGKPCAGCGRRKNLPFSSRMCANYTLNGPMMTLQMQHMPLRPQDPTTVIFSAIHQSSPVAGSRHSLLRYSCSGTPRTPALPHLMHMCKRRVQQDTSHTGYVNSESVLLNELRGLADVFWKANGSFLGII